MDFQTYQSLKLYKPKNYPHFDQSFGKYGQKRAYSLVTNPQKVATHSFYPFMAFQIANRRFRKGDDGNPKIDVKTRDIRYAAHRDGYIYTYYAYLLSQLYEQELNRRELGENVIAYRPLDRKCNIDFANEAFDAIKERNSSVALALDFSKFFETICHQNLKRQWCKLLGVDRLPDDHFAVFKSLTRYAYTELEEVQSALGLDKVKRQDLPRPICDDASVFRELRKQKIVKVHGEEGNGPCKECGIPQGSAMSALLSNISMLDFDEQLTDFVEEKCGGYYRRYSDDILIVVDQEQEQEVYDFIQSIIVETVGKYLQFNDDKAVVCYFTRDPESGNLITSKPLDYLGFTFDGKKVRVRASSLSRYYRKMIQKVRAAKNRAAKSARNGGDGRLYKRKIYRMFSHLAKRQRNFITYAQRAEGKVNDSAVERQVSKHWNRLQVELQKPRKVRRKRRA